MSMNKKIRGEWFNVANLLAGVAGGSAGLAVVLIGHAAYIKFIAPETQAAKQAASERVLVKGDKEAVKYAPPFALPAPVAQDFKPAAKAATYSHEAIILHHTVLRECASLSCKPVATMERGIQVTMTGGERGGWVPVEVTDASKQRYVGFIPAGQHKYNYIN